MRRKLELFVIVGGAGIATIIGATVIRGLNTIAGIGAVLTAGAGHDPGNALSALFMGMPLYGSVVALCAAVLCGWLVRKCWWNDRVMHGRVFNRTNFLIVIVGSLGMIIVVGLGASISAPETCRHVGLFLSTKWQSIGNYMSSIGWYFLFLAGAAFLCGFLAGLLGVVVGGLSGGLFGTVAGILMGRVRQRHSILRH